MQRLKTEARGALDAGDFTRTEELLNQAKARDLLVIERMRATMERMQAALDARQLSAAEAAAANGDLMMTRLCYAAAVPYYAEAVGLTPETYPEPLSERLTGWAEPPGVLAITQRPWTRPAALWPWTRRGCRPRMPGSASTSATWPPSTGPPVATPRPSRSTSAPSRFSRRC